MPSGHPHIAQRTQRYQLRRVLGQPCEASRGEADLALDHSGWWQACCGAV